MKSKEDLFLLINAMSKSEKRYFTLDAQKSGRKESKYLELFQAVNEQEEYDEVKLKKKFGRNLAHDKHYLYEAILRSMRDYRSAKSYTAQIKEMILDSKYLYERGLYEQSEERLEEAKKLALELDDQLALLEINREIRSAIGNSKNDQNLLLNRLTEEKDKNIIALQEEFRYLDIAGKLVIEMKKDFDLSHPKLLDQFEEKFPKELFNATNEPEALHAKRRYYQSVAMYAELFKDYETITKYYGKVVDWWDKNPKFKEEEFSRYIVDISNLLSAYARTGGYEKILPILNKLEANEIANYHDRVVVFQKSSLYRLMYYINTGHSEGIQNFIEKVDKGLLQYSISTGAKLVTIFNVAVLLFINESFKECHNWCLKIIKGIKSDLRQDIQHGVYLLNIVAAYETETPDGFDRILRATLRYFTSKTKIKPDEFERMIIDYFRRLANVPLSEVPGLYVKMKTYLSVYQHSSHRTALGLDELLVHYCNSRLERKPISVFLRRNRA